MVVPESPPSSTAVAASGGSGCPGSAILSYPTGNRFRCSAIRAIAHAFRPGLARIRHAVPLVALLCMGLAPGAAWPAPQNARQGSAPDSGSIPPRLGFIESLYQAGDDFRAESEMLALLFEAPDSSLRPEVELARAKVYYRERRFADADVMLL